MAASTPAHDPWLDGFRRRCDPLADAALAAITEPGPPLLACERRADRGDPACRRFLEVTGRLPSWVDPRQHRAGRRMFERNGLLTFLVGFTVLVDSYAGSNDNKVLTMSGRLDGAGAFRRLAETAAFVNAVVTEGSLHPGAPGHRAILAVRLLHARVRSLCRRAGYDVARYDEPINQEAMCGTLMFFSCGVVRGLEKLGVHVTAEEKQSYHRLWRTAGWLLGVEPALLPETYEDEVCLYERIKAHQYWPDQDTRRLFDAAVAGIATGARALPVDLVLMGGGLLRSERLLRALTRYCVDPRLGRYLVEDEHWPLRGLIELMRAVVMVGSRLQRLPGLEGAAHHAQARMLRRVIEALMRGQPGVFDDPGFSRAALT